MMHSASKKAPVALCVGAGKEQLPFIKKARDIGYEVVVLDVNPEAVGLQAATIPYEIDIKDVASVIRIARKHAVDLTLPVPIGKTLTTQAAVNEALGLRGVGIEAAETCTDKAKFHALCESADVEVPLQKSFLDLHDLQSELEQGLGCKYPVVVKPTNGSGSRGVAVAFNDREVLDNLLKFDAHTYADGILVEEFVEGEVLGIDGVVERQKPYLTLIRRKILTVLPYRVEYEHITPPSLPSQAMECIQKVINRICDGLGLDAVAFHADAIWTPDNKLYIVEFSPRPSGLGISSKMVEIVTGVDYKKELILLAHHGEADFTVRKSMASSLLFPAGLPGYRRLNLQGALLNQLQGIVDYVLPLAPKAVSNAPRCVAELLAGGHILSVAETLAELDTVSSNLRNLLLKSES